MGLLYKVVLLLIFIATFHQKCNGETVSNDSNPVLTIQNGAIQGKKAKTIGKGQTYYAFQGIPFAQPPIGELRFKPPISSSNWTGILNATQDKSECVQNANPVIGSEDCLYINVYTTSLIRRNLTVMVWIYGGGFTSGDSKYTTYGPDYFLEEDVIFVSFNYRLGVFGFLSTEDLTCPGNIGLKDQILALKWIQRNIKYFGGNPDNVTIFGESAGAASVSYLLQSNLSKGLFKAAIMESGTSLCLWALNRRARSIAFGIGQKLKINTTNSSRLIEGLININYTTLQEASVEVSVAKVLQNPLRGIMFSPVIEPYHTGAVFYNYSDLLLSLGQFHQVPTIIGFNSNEAAAVGEIPAILRLFLLQYDADARKLVPVDLTTNQNSIAAASVEIKWHYFKLLPLSVQTDSVIKFISDDQFNRPIRRTVIDQVKYAPVYFYKFSYQGALGGRVNRTLKGVGHAEELGYLFRRTSNFTITVNDTLIRSRMVKLWTNFAKYSNPTPVRDSLLQNVIWLNAGIVPENLIYLNIDLETELELNPFNTDMRFYDHIYDRYGSPPFNTY